MAATGTKGRDRSTGAQTVGEPDLAADIQQLREDVARLTEHLRETGNRSMSRAREAAMESAEEWQHDLTEAVREKPITALALAAGAGWLFAMMMRR